MSLVIFMAVVCHTETRNAKSRNRPTSLRLIMFTLAELIVYYVSGSTNGNLNIPFHVADYICSCYFVLAFVSDISWKFGYFVHFLNSLLMAHIQRNTEVTSQYSDTASSDQLL